MPWFTTLFGRDSLITSLQAISFAPRLAVQTLEILAERQATAVDAWRDAEPGKILHELRTGEMSRTGELPFAPYYGSVDSTPLWLILLGETHDWTGDDDLVDRLWPNALAALDWIDNWGDRDGDGFVEYERAAETRPPEPGLEGLSRRDPLAGRFARGNADRPGRGPGLRLRREAADGQACAAPWRRSALADRLETRGTRPAESVRGAVPVARRIDLDGARRAPSDPSTRSVRTPDMPCGAGSSSAEHARRSSPALGTPAMVSGLGRCGRSRPDQPGYNPIGYHTGTVWPHDTAIAAAGLRRYGFDEAADTLSSGMLAAAQHFPAFRLPGAVLRLRPGATGSPIAYPVACSPQAWAAGRVADAHPDDARSRTPMRRTTG